MQAFINPIGLERIGWRYYIVFCVLLVVFLSITWFSFPETKGYSLEEITAIFDSKDLCVKDQWPVKGGASIKGEMPETIHQEEV